MTSHEILSIQAMIYQVDARKIKVVYHVETGAGYVRFRNRQQRREPFEHVKGEMLPARHAAYYARQFANKYREATSLVFPEGLR